MASIFPLLILTFYAYQVESRPEELWLGIGNSVLIFVSISHITPINFYLSKLVHFIAAFGVIFVISVVLPFLRYEYFLMPLTMLTVFSTYAFQKGIANIITGILCVIASIILFFIEVNQTETYPEYAHFNRVFQFILLDITIVEIIMTALIEKTYREMIELDRNKMKDQKADLHKYIESNLQLENFAYLASHDLKTPLYNILRFSQLLKQKLKGKLTEDETKLFDFIIKDSKRMNDTINSLFNFFQANNNKVVRSNFEFNHFIDKVLFDISQHLTENQAAVTVNTPKIYINVDKMLFKQMWLHLILNSIKFAKSDIPPQINIHAHDADDYWQFHIRDNGIGIAKEYLNNIFVIFKRLHSSDAIEGTRKGLAICKTIIESHNGKIWANSDGINGSSFYIRLPKS